MDSEILWHDSFLRCVTRRIPLHLQSVTQFYVWHDPLVLVTFPTLTYDLTQFLFLSSTIRHTILCVTRPTFTRDISYFNVWLDLIFDFRYSDMTHSFSWWVLQHCTGFARLVWGRLRVHRAFVYSDWFVCYVWVWASDTVTWPIPSTSNVWLYSFVCT